ncbi:copper chaperone PCu(A)C [Nocardiopsis sp. MG754419]|uniref:copper chaperone PCu(A)C n=1 Tax=Nocardiopsis sp. MG754419 TaxID=2259865 RepID=UPI001BA5FA88|nr:copper chaperone PCu(A)C [Nocardiopsis sp. MG754419]MBR8744252.1 hypothetical protein [Nocardiopsis sp. MG754419]
MHHTPRPGRRTILAALALTLPMSACSGGPGSSPEAAAVAGDHATPVAVEDLLLADAWMPEPANPEVGVVYLAVTNTAEVDDAVVAVRTDASEDADLCRTEVTASGASVMRTVEEVPVPAGGTTTFVDGGYHVMVNDIPDPLRVGDTLTVTLDFASRTEVELEVPVREMTGDAGDQGDHSEDHSHH